MEKPQLLIKPWKLGEPFVYRCSLCGQEFIAPEDRSAKEGMAELWAAFHEHIEEVHGCSCSVVNLLPKEKWMRWTLV